ncbi:hypothetical protein BD560DRAFT_347560 [Blakeslea trispora]|nr:hypothetical protein BD560DRAFT_347560 [Blakeslea trispora]
MSTQNSNSEVIFSSIPTYSQHEDPSFLESQSDMLFEGAGVLERSTGEAAAQLTTAWSNERNAPEILPYERGLVEFLLETVEQQVEKVMEDMENHVENKFESMVYQTEIERVKYVIKSYLRCRLFKIEKFTLHLLRLPNLKELLSHQEIIYARSYQELMESHYHHTFLHQLPRTQQKQDEVIQDMSMVVEPNLDAPVFCRVLTNVGHVVIGQSDSVLFEVGDIYILRYSDVQQHLKDKKVKLI